MDIKALLIGGIIPSIFFGIVAILVKLAMRAGISLPMYLVVVGAAVFTCGVLVTVGTGARDLNVVSAGYAIAMGIVWAAGIYCMSYGMSTLKLPVSVVAPLTNSNAIVAVLLSAVFFSEWKELNMTRVIVGTLLIVIGATVVSTSR
ncbi:MAG: hypothetical protein EXS67_05730 [Candidatus Margulisbacteria bacterium]|nr:hypothetical protein [Candidatus Margulisiibacteriota bacterium]